MSSIANSVKNKARLFFAIELSQSLKNQLELLQTSNPAFTGRAVSPHNFHITLQFLGAVTVNKIPDLIEAINIPHIKPFSLSLERYAYYPKTDIGCIEIIEGKQRLKEIKRHINSCLGYAGLAISKDNHSFRPHITLFRDCQPLLGLEKALDFECRVEAFCLMQSHQNDKGVYYEVLEEWPIYEPSIKEQFFGVKD